MAGIGAFLGGAAEGMSAAKKQALAEKTQEDSNDIAQQQLGLERQRIGAAAQNTAQAKATGVIKDLFGVIQNFATNYRAAGHNEAETAQAVTPLLQHAIDLAPHAGIDPNILTQQARLLVTTPAAPGTADQQNYEYYANQERSAGREPASFADYTANVKKAGANNTTVNMSGETAFAKELGEGSAKDLETRRTAALDAVKSLQSTDQARTLLDSGVITGTGADWLLSAGKALQQFGYHGADDAIANTESFAAQRAQETATIIKNFGAGSGLSDADREYALNAAAGKITLGEQSIRKILDINSRASRNVIRSYNADASKVDPHIVPFDLRVAEPPERAAPPVTKTINGKTYVQQNGKWFEQ